MDSNAEIAQELRVIVAWQKADPGWVRTAQVFRATFDQLYDGQRTGRYRWGQLYKTEKTHFGTLLEINLRRTFADFISDGVKLDFVIAGSEIDCKFSMTEGGWMVPPEAFGELLLGGHASVVLGFWSLGVVRATNERLLPGRNRDQKAQLNPEGRAAVLWMAHRAELPPNVLVSLDEATIARIFGPIQGQARVNELLRCVTNRRITRNTIATVAQQDDFMKRVRYNGGARSALRPEGFLIPGGDYAAHLKVAHALGAVLPRPGEVVSLRVVPSRPYAPASVELDGTWWRQAEPGEPSTVPAPLLPDTRRSAGRGA